jgi:hypothetical protein
MHSVHPPILCLPIFSPTVPDRRDDLPPIGIREHILDCLPVFACQAAFGFEYLEVVVEVIREAEARTLGGGMGLVSCHRFDRA